MLLRSTNRSIDRSRWFQGRDLPERTRRRAPVALLASVPSSPILPSVAGIESAVQLSIKEEFFNKIRPHRTLGGRLPHCSGKFDVDNEPPTKVRFPFHLLEQDRHRSVPNGIKEKQYLTESYKLNTTSEQSLGLENVGPERLLSGILRLGQS
jgi:hypothetical protein